MGVSLAQVAGCSSPLLRRLGLPAGLALALGAAHAQDRSVLEIFDPGFIRGGPASFGVLQAIHGRWQGDGLEIQIDTYRMQGNTDPAKPFTRESLVIRDVTPPWIVFAIGPSAFVAQVEGETMTLTQAGWPSPRTVVRIGGRP